MDSRTGKRSRRSRRICWGRSAIRFFLLWVVGDLGVSVFKFWATDFLEQPSVLHASGRLLRLGRGLDWVASASLNVLLPSPSLCGPSSLCSYDGLGVFEGGSLPFVGVPVVMLQ